MNLRLTGVTIKKLKIMMTFRMFAAMTAIVMGTMTMSANNSKVNAGAPHESELHTYNYGNVKVVYAVNDEGQVVSKTSYRLNAKTGEWIPNFIYQATYTGDNSTLSYSRWNKFSHKFNCGKQSQKVNEETLKMMMSLPASK